jgi:hypothetical protein
VVACGRFRLASRLPSSPSAARLRALFETFFGVGSGEAAERDAPLPPPALPNCPCSFPYPYQRFVTSLATGPAWLGAEMDRYSFLVRLFHSLHLAA